LSVCKADGDTPVNSEQEKRKEETSVNKYTSATEVENKRQGEELTFSGSRHGAKTLRHGLLSLSMLLVGFS
jgi:hypothetical protein